MLGGTVNVAGAAGRSRGLDLPLSCVVSSVQSDAHTWSLVVLELLLEDAGHAVVNLGPCPPDALVLAECRRAGADLLVLSTTNGHGSTDAARLIGLVRRDPGLDGIAVVVGGQPTCDGAAGETAGELRAAGFDAVFEGPTALESFESYVRELRRQRQPARVGALAA